MKPKLLIIHNRLVVGGPALDTIPLAHHLSDTFDIHILYGKKEADETEPAFLLEKYKGLKLVKIESLQRSLQPVKDFRAYRFIKNYIRQFKPDIVHTHGAKVGVFGRIAACRAKVPLVIHTFHGHLFHSYFNSFYTSLLIKMERQLLRTTNHVIAISQLQKTELEKILRVKDPGKVILIPLGVDYIDHSMKDHYKQAFRRSFHIENGTVCIGLLGRLVDIKNPVFFLDVVEYVLNHYKEGKIKFFVVGDGYEKPAMMQYLQKKGIQYTETGTQDAPVIFTSWIQNIQNVLEGLDIVVLTSNNEGTPMSLIEAQLCEKPVVAVNVGGVSDTMIDGETGIMINHHNLEQFSKAVIRLAANKNLRETMGEKGSHFASAAFSKQKEISALRDLYLSVPSS